MERGIQTPRIQDDPIEGYPLAPTEPNLVAKTEELLLEDKWVTFNSLAREVNINRSSLQHIAYHLGVNILNKVATWWDPRMPLQKQQYMECTERILDLYRKSEEDFLNWLVITEYCISVSKPTP